MDYKKIGAWVSVIAVLLTLGTIGFRAIKSYRGMEVKLQDVKSDVKKIEKQADHLGECESRIRETLARFDERIKHLERE